MNKKTEKRINKIYSKVFKSTLSAKNLKDLENQKSSRIIKKLLRLKHNSQYDAFAKKFAKELAKEGLSEQKGLWQKYYKSAKKHHQVGIPSTYKEYELQIFEKAINENFKMIKSIPEKVLKLYQEKSVELLINSVALNKIGRRSFYNQLKEKGAKNARVIARTEAAKLQTTIDEHRATSLGSVCYEWLSSNDRRTRPSHRAMNGVIVFWRNKDEKPLLDNMRGNAGEFPNCRCTPIPILDEKDLKKSSYKVYNYKTDKIITLSRSELLEKIKNKSL